MLYRSHIPEPPLSELVELMWFSDDYLVPHALERVLPTGDMSLIINLYEDRTRTYDQHEHANCKTLDGSIVVGAYSEFTVIDTAEQRSTIGAVFKPGGAFPFFGLPASELQDTGLSLETVWGAEASYLRERLLQARTPEAKFAVLEGALSAKMAKTFALPHPAVHFAVGSFRRLPNRAISSVTDQMGLSDRRFIQLFAQQVGLTPKLCCRVQRFQKALRHIARSNACIDWTQIALSCGYFDQAHFIHDFRAFSGMNPSSYIANKTQFQNHVVLRKP
jgi:AraC-like DNA-binding protein